MNKINKYCFFDLCVVDVLTMKHTLSFELPLVEKQGGKLCL